MRVETSARVWRYGTANSVLIGGAAGVMAAVGIFILGIPLLLGGGDVTTASILGLSGLGVFAMAVFMAFGFVAMLRTRIRLAGVMLDATVPAGHNALLVPRFRTVHVDDVTTLRAVEKRDEIVRSFGFSVLCESLSIVTAAGDRIGLISDEYGYGMPFPLEAAGAGIAAAAGRDVADAGIVRAKASAELYGAASSNWTEPRLDAASAAKARHSAVFTARIILVLTMLTIVLRAWA